MNEQNRHAAAQLLTQNHIAVLATLSSEDSKPQASVVYYTADVTGHIYFVTAKNSRKLANIVKNPQVAFVVLHETKAIELQIEGTATEVVDEKRKNDIVVNIGLTANEHPRSPGWPPLLTLAMNSGVDCVEVSIVRFKYSDFSIHPGTIIEGVGKDLLLV